MTRVKDVIDCWFDSGSMPFAQHHYPFENKENFDKLFPADFICEGIDQTRGWFYSLIAISTFVTGKSPYKRVLVNDLILDKEGRKMSKSRGNTVDPFEMFDKYGADTLRWYLLYVSPPWVPTRFDEEGLKEVKSKFFGTVKNVYNFFTLYANTDNVDPREFNIPYENRPELDRWILSKFNTLVAEVGQALDVFDLTKAVKQIQDFVNEALSNWYIRRSRRRFWASQLTDDKKAVYNTTYEILVGLSQLIAPLAPFTAEEMYKKLTEGLSVHLTDYPQANLELVDKGLEERMDLVRELVTLGRATRESARIKVRQPVQKIMVDARFESQIGYLVPLMMEELNVKEIVFSKEIHQFMDFTIKPNFKVLGSVLGPKLRFFNDAVSKLDAADAVLKIDRGEKVTIDLDGEPFELDKENVLVSISTKEGFNVATSNDLFVVLDTTLNQELIYEGLARELVSKVQQMRKNNDYEVLDNIKITVDGDEEVNAAVEDHKEYIMKETLAVEMVMTSDSSIEKVDLNGHLTGIAIERVR